MKTIAIVGAGPALGMSMARRFGRAGYRVALLARTESRLAGFVDGLAAEGITAAAFPADVANREALATALAHVGEELGSVDVLAYQPAEQRSGGVVRPVETTVASLLPHLDSYVLGPITAVQAVLPGMLERGDGALLITGALSGTLPIPSHANTGIALAGLKNYVYVLNAGLAEKGIYAGTITVAGLVIGSGSDPGPDNPTTSRFRVDPDQIADLYFDMALSRNRVEEFVGDPDGIAESPWRW